MVSPLAHDDPQAIGPYTLVARLGSGGMGTVYLGRSAKGRTVALKTVHEHFAAQTEFRTRFRLEADAARIIGGQYGAEVIDADSLAPTPWLATEYVLGPPLDEAVVFCGVLPESAARVLGAALCDALAQLHRSGVVHRDLKPSNILLTALGPKVIDFGIARAAGDDRLTRTGSTAGTPAYMSPEQAIGGEHTAAGDVFALSAVLAFTVSGSPPFGSGQPADLLYRVRYADPDLSGVPDGLRPVLARGLAKDPEQRPDTTELRTLLHDGGGDFAEHLPDTVLAEIARRAAAVWQPQPPRQPAPDAHLTTSAADPRRPRIGRRKLLAAGAVLAAGGAAGAAYWLRDDRASGRGNDDRAGAPRRSPGGASRMSWKASVGDSGQEADLFTVGDSLAFVSEGGLHFLDARTGKRRGVNEQIISSDAVASGGRGLFALDDTDFETARIVPVNLTTGAFGTPIAEVRHIAAGDLRFLGAVGRSLVLEGETRDGWQRIAVNSRTGKEMWRRPMSDSGNAADIMATPTGSSLIRSDGERVSLIDARDGTTRWTTKIPKKMSGGLSPGARHSFSADHLFIGTWELLALRLSDGEVAWSFGKGREFGASYEPGAQHYGPPVVKDGVVYAMERLKGLVAVDAGSGRLLWEEKGDSLDYDFSATPAIGDRYFYASPDNDSQWIAAIDLRTHRVAWTFASPWGDVGGLSPTITALPKARRAVVMRATSVCAVPLE
ncbi:protein kinase domain-containing protein [Streptomyces sp. RTd22]|uniref:serine/threonine-protein kinase n=1 Tax=Streptomyces sp. RTd22 TaxID=1841249 RepID=UPI0007C4F6D6|nr:serine/threonine-protein kinase [Streptomyces sp. RTd22]